MDKGAYTVPEFCLDHGISRAFFYELLRAGRAPRVMKLGKRTLISREAAAQWRARMETETAAATAGDSCDQAAVAATG